MPQNNSFCTIEASYQIYSHVQSLASHSFQTTEPREKLNKMFLLLFATGQNYKE